ncbi:MAG: CDP-diacylglycerol--serine O-phosphatidyltransferase [Chromatiales bacterium]|nr:MAG: CDP-diacylglycerol--serine O-phosphatidyltransferase [Chromatiales bacterium]
MSRLRYTVPNGFTALSLMLGVASIVTTQLGELELAAWFIVWCGLLDVMDGLSARLLKATSDFGAEFDSMADLVSFGVAPAVLVLNAGLQIGGIELDSDQFWVLLVAIGVFALTGAMRLARFNLTSDQPTSGWFAGVPITAAGGGMVPAVVLVLIHHPDVASLLPLQLYLPVLMFVLALLMISRLRFPKAVRRNNLAMNIFQGSVILVVYYCGITRSWPEVLLLIGIVTLVTGIIVGRITRES